ncbi:MAG: aldehyde dehydrogenase family protein [Vampirovibrionales bacterium]|nr:aldehyde dehydrogenase family protein [Vampirovibrionales bacterium]
MTLPLPQARYPDERPNDLREKLPIDSPHVFEKRNPATEGLVGQYAVALWPEVDAAIKHASRHQPAWQANPPQQRALVLRTAAKLLYAQRHALAECVAAETGKTTAEALLAEITPAIAWLNYCAQHAPKWLKPQPATSVLQRLVGQSAVLYPRAYGTIAVITPWNYPLGISVSGLASGLMAGNAVIYKPSELAPETGLALAELFKTALLEATKNEANTELIQLVLGDARTGEALIHHPELQGVLFTGSESTGRAIERALRPQGKPVWLELGGNDAMVVLPGACETQDALDAIASNAFWGRMTNAGQTCSAVKRLYVHEADADALAACLADKANQLNQSRMLMPLISRDAQRKIITQVEDALDNGAVALAGGYALEGPGYYYPATILCDMLPQARVLQEEVFGPVLPVIRYSTPQAAIDEINQNNLGLSASIFGPLAQAESLAGKITSGMVSLNTLPHSNYGMAHLPWTGWGRSGPGVSHGKAGLLALTRIQVINQTARPKKQPWFYPASLTPEKDSTARLANAMAGLLHSKNPLASLKHILLLGWSVVSNRSTTRL